jgi:transcriptional regulator with XRE-family HTH domain
MTRTRENQTLCRLLRSLRVDAALRQQDLAKRLGVGQSFVSKYESGERRLDVFELREICHACGVTLGTFIERLEAHLAIPIECEPTSDS